MIKANELRIGNYVRYYGNNDILKIANIDTRKRKGWSNGYIIEESEKELNKTAISALEPIKLTEEWLIKFRFENIKNRWFHDELNLKIIKSEGFYMTCITEELKFVHQLQNIFFALTGNELSLS